MAAWLTFVIVGAGPTGVELAGALAEVAHKTLREGFRHIEPSSRKNSFGRPCGPMSCRGIRSISAQKAEKALRRLRVTVRTRCRVTDVLPGEVVLGEGAAAERIQTHTVLWTSGVRGSVLGAKLAQATGASVDKGGRVVVEPDLSVLGHPSIFVIGDLANPNGKDKPSLPGVAPVAMQQGKYVAERIKETLKGRTTGPFIYHDHGSFATIGRNAAVADLGRLRFDGFFAWLVWAFVHIFKLLVFENRLLVMTQWAWNYVSVASDGPSHHIPTRPF